MHGQELNAQRFTLTSSSQQDYCQTVARISSRRPSAIRTATVPNDGPDAITGRWDCHPLPTVHATTTLAEPTGAPPLRWSARDASAARPLRTAPSCAAAHAKRTWTARPPGPGANWRRARATGSSQRRAEPRQRSAPCRPQPHSTTPGTDRMTCLAGRLHQRQESAAELPLQHGEPAAARRIHPRRDRAAHRAGPPAGPAMARGDPRQARRAGTGTSRHQPGAHHPAARTRVPPREHRGPPGLPPRGSRTTAADGTR